MNLENKKNNIKEEVLAKFTCKVSGVFCFHSYWFALIIVLPAYFYKSRSPV